MRGQTLAELAIKKAGPKVLPLKAVKEKNEFFSVHATSEVTISFFALMVNTGEEPPETRPWGKIDGPVPLCHRPSSHPPVHTESVH